jgi:hypothetical protein
MLQGSKERSPARGFNPEKKQPERLRVWNQFIQRKKIVTSGVPSYAAESRIRPRYRPINCYPNLSLCDLPKDQYEQTLPDNKHRIPLARQILETVFESFGPARCVVAPDDQ